MKRSSLLLLAGFLSQHKSKTSVAQAGWHAALRREGYAVAVCYGCDAAWQTVQAYVRGDYR